MKQRRLRLYGDFVLLEKCTPVINITDDIEELVLDMIDATKKYGGVGISAPQLGETCQIMVIKSSDVNKEKIIINPEVLSQSNESIKSVEGCLSLPGIIHEVDRPSWAEIKYLNIDGSTTTEKLEDNESCIFFHELDHLHGRLLTFHMSTIRQGLIQKKLRNISKFNKLSKKLLTLDKPEKS